MSPKEGVILSKYSRMLTGLNIYHLTEEREQQPLPRLCCDDTSKTFNFRCLTLWGPWDQTYQRIENQIHKCETRTPIRSAFYRRGNGAAIQGGHRGSITETERHQVLKHSLSSAGIRCSASMLVQHPALHFPSSHVSVRSL